MEEFFNDVHGKAGRKNETKFIKFFANGGTTNACTIAAHRGEDELWKIKKRLLKKLGFKNYKSAQL